MIRTHLRRGTSAHQPKMRQRLQRVTPARRKPHQLNSARQRGQKAKALAQPHQPTRIRAQRIEGPQVDRRHDQQGGPGSHHGPYGRHGRHHPERDAK
ncbi:hypothetical protein D3C72_1580570 [compost metagenome]